MKTEDKQKRLAEIEEALSLKGYLPPIDAEWLIAELKAAWAREEWQPIETAPKDGTKIMGYCRNVDPEDLLPAKGGDPMILYWFEDPNDGENGWALDCLILQEDEVLWIDNITHWAPLRQPPALSQQEGGG